MLCPTCGERIDGQAVTCPYCETEIEPAEAPRVGMATINLKKGRPTVAIARDRLDAAVENHRLRGTEGLLVIHGYGSSGEGGKIRPMVRERLDHLKYDGAIRDFVRGEDIGIAASDRFPSSYRPRREDVGNAGITIVKL